MSVLRRIALVLVAAALPSCFFTCNSMVDYCEQTRACVCPGNSFDTCCVNPGGECSGNSDCCGGTSVCSSGRCSLPLRRDGTACLPALSECSDGGTECCSNLCSSGVCICHQRPGGHCESKGDCCYPNTIGPDNCGPDLICIDPAADGGF